MSGANAVCDMVFLCTFCYCLLLVIYEYFYTCIIN